MPDFSTVLPAGFRTELETLDEKPTGVTVVQTAPGATVASRPDVPNGFVRWLLFDAPGTVDGPDDVQPLDLIFNISGTEW